MQEYSAIVYKRTQTRKHKRAGIGVSRTEKLYTVLTFLWCPVAIQDPSKGPELGIHPLSATSVGGLDSLSFAFLRPRNLYDTCFVFIVSGPRSIRKLHISSFERVSRAVWISFSFDRSSWSRNRDSFASPFDDCTFLS